MRLAFFILYLGLALPSLATVANVYRVKGTIEKVEKDRVYFRVGKKLTTVPRSAFEPDDPLRVGCLTFATFEGDPFTSPLLRNTAEMPPPAPKK